MSAKRKYFTINFILFIVMLCSLFCLHITNGWARPWFGSSWTGSQWSALAQSGSLLHMRTYKMTSRT